MKQKLGHWLPMGFCAALSLICVTAFIPDTEVKEGIVWR
jgi:hypothetical protein